MTTAKFTRMKVTLVLVLASVLILSGCVFHSKYDEMQKQAELKLPEFEKAFKEKGCFNLRFKFVNNMSFSKQDAYVTLECLEIERVRNELRETVNGTISQDELSATYAYDNNRAIFTFLENEEIALPKARGLYKYINEKSEMDAVAEINRSNELLLKDLENRRLQMERANRENALFIERLKLPVTPTPTIQPVQIKYPTNTTCTKMISGDLHCSSW